MIAGCTIEKLTGGDFAEIIVTDTVPVNPLDRPESLKVLPVSSLLAETILSVFSDSSVSAIFEGENQLCTVLFGALLAFIERRRPTWRTGAGLLVVRLDRSIPASRRSFWMRPPRPT